ncbi:MAG TPA: TolC family protein [Chthoniobacteraceae bacterium]|nr:TolC family protein [Chthoniobacteraceae bacterium]
MPRSPLKGAPAGSGGNEFRTSGRVPVKRFVGDMTIEQAVSLALSQNPQILTAIQEIERTRGQIIEVRAAALPHITASGVYEQQDRRLIKGGGFGAGGTSSSTNSGLATSTIAQSSGTNTGNAAATNSNRTTAAAPVNGTSTTAGAAATATSNEDLVKQLSALFASSDNSSAFIQNKSWNVTIEARQAIYAGGQIRAALQIAQLTNDSAYFSLRDVVDTVISNTRQQFYNVLLTRALILVQEESVRLLEQQRQDQQNRFEAGTVPRFNVLQAEVALANQQPLLIRARNDYQLAQLQLGRTLNLDATPTTTPTFHCVGVLNAGIRKINLADAMTLAQARRPFLKVQRQAILIDLKNVTVQMAGYKPRIDAHGGYEFKNRPTAEDLSDVVNGWFFGFTGSWNIFDGFETYGLVKQARARVEQAKINYLDAVHQVDQEVQTAYLALQQARQTIASQQKNIEGAAEAVRLAQERLNAGAGTQLDVLNAQVQLTQARSTELTARADYANALADFDRATATNTVYHEDFKDPLDKTQKGIFAKIAEIGLPKPSDEIRAR